MNIVVDTR